MFTNLDMRCGTESMITGISYFSAVSSALCFCVAVPVNLIILVSVVKFRHFLHRSFYLIIASIALADFLGGLIVDSLSVNYHFKETLGNVTDISKLEIQSLHYTFFVTNGASVLSMTILCLDRIGMLVNPFVYYEKITPFRTIILLVFAWLLSVGLSTFYFRSGYIRILALFAVTAIAVAIVMMIGTTVLYNKRLQESRRAEFAGCNSNGINNSRQKTLNNFTKMDKRITTTFLIMLILFLVNYLPAVVLIIYLNICQACSCEFVHIARDIVLVSILSSGVWRALNFTLRLTALREAMKTLVCYKRRRPLDANDFNFLEVTKMSTKSFQN